MARLLHRGHGRTPHRYRVARSDESPRNGHELADRPLPRFCPASRLGVKAHGILGIPSVNDNGLMGVHAGALLSRRPDRNETGQGVEWTRLNGTARGIALALAAAGALCAQTAMAAPKKVPVAAPAAGHPCAPSVQPRRSPAMSRCRANARCRAAGAVGLRAGQCRLARRAVRQPAPSSSRWRVRPSGPFAVAPTTATSAADIAAVKQVIEATRKGKEADADAAAEKHHRSGRAQARRMGDPAQRQHQSDVCSATPPS